MYNYSNSNSPQNIRKNRNQNNNNGINLVSDGLQSPLLGEYFVGENNGNKKKILNDENENYGTDQENFEKLFDSALKESARNVIINSIVFILIYFTFSLFLHGKIFFLLFFFSTSFFLFIFTVVENSI